MITQQSQIGYLERVLYNLDFFYFVEWAGEAGDHSTESVMMSLESTLRSGFSFICWVSCSKAWDHSTDSVSISLESTLQSGFSFNCWVSCWITLEYQFWCYDRVLYNLDFHSFVEWEDFMCLERWSLWLAVYVYSYCWQRNFLNELI